MKILKNRHVISCFIILSITLLVSLPLCSKNIYVLRDDGIQHIARIIGTYQSFAEREKFPVIISNLCNEFGYSWNIFYSPINCICTIDFYNIYR